MIKLTALTPAQTARLPAIRDEWLAVGLSTAPADRVNAERGVAMAYEAAGLAPPKVIIWLDSPFQGAVAAAMLAGSKFGPDVRAQVWAQVWDQVRAQVRAQVGRAAYGSHDSSWLGFYHAIQEFGVPSPSLDGMRLVARSCGWWWPFAGAAVLTERPAVNKLDERGLLHCEDGPAIQYRDGFSIYAWRGTRIPSEWITDKANLTATVALTWENLEQRRCALQIVGWDAVLSQLNARVVDADADPHIGTLLDVQLPDLPTRSRFVRLQCGTGRTFAVCVPPDTETAIAGQAWMMGKTPTDFLPPEIRT